MEVKYKDLSMPLKIGIIFAWIIGTIWTLAFIIEIILAIIEAVLI